MGSGSAKPQTIKVHFDVESSCTNLEADVENKKVIKTPTKCHVTESTLVSDGKLELAREKRVEISCKGGGVVRFGLTSTDPSVDKNILKGCIFEREEGFGPHKTTRILYKSDFDYICFGPRDEEREYETQREASCIWLYVIYVYGGPEIKAKLVDRDSNEYENISLSSLTADKPIPAANTAVCRIREPIVSGDVYHCHWDMKLENEDVVGKSRGFGYMRLKLVSNNKGEERPVWERSSAVREYPFSSVIAFCLSMKEETVSHNLFATSVGPTKKDKFSVKLESTTLYLVIELSSGEINVEHARKGLIVRQDPGSILMVKNYKSESEDVDTVDLLLEIGSKIKYKPRRLLFGDSPGIFVLEFNERLSNTDVEAVGAYLACEVLRLKETDTVQTITDDTEVDAFEVEQHFSRESVGGGTIKSIEKDADIPGCWIIKYGEKEVARSLWMAKTHSFTAGNTRVTARVFPVFKGLGLVVNNGEIPKYDTTTLHVEVDKMKLRFIVNRDSEKKSFELKINGKIEVNVIWETSSVEAENDEFESDFEGESESEDDEVEPRSISFECRVKEADGKKLAVWKQITRRSVAEYFEKNIHEVAVPVGDGAVENVLDSLHDLQEKYDFEYEENRTNYTIRLCGTDSEILSEVAKIAGKPTENQEIVTEKVKVHVQAYLALDAEGILYDLKVACQDTSFKVDRTSGTVSLRGPKEEVKTASLEILKLAIETKIVQIPLAKEHVEFLKRGGQKVLNDQFRRQKMNYNFFLVEDRLDVVIYTGNNDEERKKRRISSAIELLIKSCTVQVDKESVQMLQTYEWKTFKKEIENRHEEPLIISESGDMKIIHIIGTEDTMAFAKDEVENYLKCKGGGRYVIRVPVEVAEYLDEYPSDKYRDNLECVKDSNGCLTCELSIHGEIRQLERIKSAVAYDVKRVNIHWFYINKPWIASVIQDLTDLKTLSNDKKALLQVTIGDSLADQGITCVALLQKTGTVIQVRHGDITFETTSVIVNTTNGHAKSFDKGLGKCFVQIGGEEIKAELLEEIKKRKKVNKGKGKKDQSENDGEAPAVFGQTTGADKKTLNDKTANSNKEESNLGFNLGDVIETAPGRIRCLKLMHVFGPTGIDGSKSEERKLKSLIRKLLQMCQDEGLTSIAIPAICCGAKNDHVDKATTYIVEAVADFIENTRNVVVKEVILCDISKTTVEKLTSALEILKDPWFVFKHGKEVKMEDMGASLTRQSGSQLALQSFVNKVPTGQTTRPISARPKSAGIKWGRQQAHGNRRIKTDLQREKTIPEVNAEFKDGLPYNIPLSEKLTLHIIKGDLTKQAVNVIVNTTASFPDLTGEVARAVIKAGGDTIQHECNSLGKIAEGELRATKPGRLNCDEIYHVLIPHKWNHETGPDLVQRMVTSCLNQAMNNGHSKVAFPVIGSGKAGFPPDKVANSTIKAICEAGKGNKKSSLTDVSIVVYSMSEGVCQVTCSNGLCRTYSRGPREMIQCRKKVKKDVCDLLANSVGPDQTARMRRLVWAHAGRIGLKIPEGNFPRGSKRHDTVKYVAPPSFHNRSVADDVAVIKVTSTMDAKVIQKQLDTIVEKQFIEKILNYQTLSEEQTLTEPEESALKTLQLKHGVNVEIDKKTKHVKITGLKKRVDDCELEAISLLEDEFHRWRLKEKQIRAVAASVQWHYKDADGRMHAVDRESNWVLHMEYLKGQDFNYYNSTEKKQYHVIIGDMAEHPSHDPSKRRALYLRTNVDTDINLPDNWSIKEKGGDCAEVRLSEYEAEFNDVKDMIIKGGCPDIKIISITRLENRYMWLQYQTKKNQLDKQSPQSQNERRLWHGTNIDTVQKIIKNGYDRSFAGNANFTAYGKGVYFAARSEYSNRDQYAARDANGVKRMFWNRVLTGVYCKGSQDLATLPYRPGVLLNNFPVFFDSAVDDERNPGIFVIFHDTQAYPEYLIEYTA